MINTEEDWKTTDLNVDSLLIIDRRDSLGKHENNYHGSFIPQIPNQLIRRYTNKNDTVLELFTGSGTTLYGCEKLNRNYIGFDINSEMINFIGDIYRKSEVVPLGFYVMDAIKKNFKVKMKDIIVKNIEGNQCKLGSQGIWKYRALNSDYFLFKHEYIFVSKKEF